MSPYLSPLQASKSNARSPLVVSTQRAPFLKTSELHGCSRRTSSLTSIYSKRTPTAEYFNHSSNKG